MKSISLFLMALSLSATTHAFGGGGSTLLPEMNVQLDLRHSSLNVSDLQVSYSVSCKYKAGLFWPESKSCGSATGVGTIQNDGTLHLSALSSDGITRNNLENLDVSISVKKGEAYILTLSARGKKAINEITNLKETIHVYRLEGAPLKLQVDGKNFLNTTWKSVPESSLHIALSVEPAFDLSKSYLLISLYGVDRLGADNRYYTSEERQLKNLKSITAKDAYLATLKPLADQKLRVYARYESKPGADATSFVANDYYPLTTDALKNIDAIELKSK